jgi:asparagine synthase (glutamine-hydrolysing)
LNYENNLKNQATPFTPVPIPKPFFIFTSSTDPNASSTSAECSLSPYGTVAIEPCFWPETDSEKKPLHYFEDNDKILFASEIKAILEHPDVRPEPHRPGIVTYLAYGHSVDPETLFKGIYKLPPGHTLTWNDGRSRINQYWDLHFRPDHHKSESAFLSECEDLLRESVRIRLMSEVPLGAFLSGGIDSSLVVAMMASEMTDRVKTFSIGFEDQRYNELPYARLVANRYGTDHHEEIVRPDAEAVITRVIEAFDEPFADSSAIPTYYVSRLARRHVTVVLSGDGGDELFGGYTRYRDSTLSNITDRIPSFLRRAVLGIPARHLPESFPGINTLRYLSAATDDRYLIKISKGISQVYTDIFSQELISKTAGGDPTPPLRRHLQQVRNRSPLTRRQYLDAKVYLPGDILTKVDRMSMLVSLEARAPFLDHKLTEFSTTLPTQLRVNGQQTKVLLKRLAQKLLPPELINRPKMGFALPVAEWINQEWRDLSHDLVLGTRPLQRGNFNPKFLRRIMDEHTRRRRNHSYLIWTLMVLEMWYRRFMDPHDAPLAIQSFS